AFVATLAELSGAAVQASTGLVGHEALGGSWQLQGPANAVVPFSRAARAQWRVTLVPALPGNVSIGGYAEDTASGSIPTTTLSGAVLITANAAKTTQGNWQFLNGSTWTNLATLSSGQSIYLAAGTQLRFAAKADYYGSVGALSFRAYTGTGVGLTTGTSYSLTSQAGSYGSTTYTASQGAITGVNDATQLSVSSSLTYTEGAAAQILQGTAVVSDKDDLAGATPVQRIQTASVTVAANRLSSDVLSYTGPTNFGSKTVAASYDAGTGALTFTFGQPLLVSELQTVFRNVRYSNSSDDPTDLKSGVAKTTRTVTFSLTALSNDTSTAEAPVSSNTVIYLKTDNDGASVSFAGLPLNFSEQEGADSGANAIGFGAVVSDADSTQFKALTFSYANGSILNGAAETLALVGAGGTFSGAALNAVGAGSVSLGTVTIAGATFAVSRSGAAGTTALTFQAVTAGLVNTTASEAAFNALLAALRYNNSSDDTTAGARNFSLQLTDSLGATAGAQAFTVVVSATNDIPEITVTPGADLTVTDGSDTSASGSLGISDRDSGQSFFAAEPAGVATYGSYTVSSAGAWTYALNEANASVRALAEGASIVDTFTIVSVDGSASEVITITITGTNDAPVATFETAQYATEDGGSINGSVSSTDVDSDAAPTYALVARSVARRWMPSGLAVFPWAPSSLPVPHLRSRAAALRARLH
ncbi:MAG: hypothetical protein RLZZ516_2756, partial [Cyanobacteriota bacterium]